MGSVSPSVELREKGCFHIVSLCVGNLEAGSKLLLNPADGWRPFYGMGGYGSKENVNADSINNSTNLSREYALLKLHGGTAALFAGAAASAALIYVFYKLFVYNRSRMNPARQRASKVEGRFVWGNRGGVEEEGALGRAARRLPVVPRAPPPSIQTRVFQEEDFCEECREEAAREAAREARDEPAYDALRGHFRPLPPLV